MKKILLLIHLFWIVPIIAEVPVEEPEFIWKYEYQPDSLFLAQKFDIYYFNEKLYVPYRSNYITNEKKEYTTLLSIKGVLL